MPAPTPESARAERAAQEAKAAAERAERQTQDRRRLSWEDSVLASVGSDAANVAFHLAGQSPPYDLADFTPEMLSAANQWLRRNDSGLLERAWPGEGER